MRTDNHYFSEQEMQQLLRAAKRRASRGSIVDKADYALVVFAYATGCRVGEISSTSLDCQAPNYLDLRSATLRITEAKYNSEGIVPIDVANIRILRWYIRQVRPQLKNALHLHHLFLSKTGRPYSANVLTQKFSLLLDRLCRIKPSPSPSIPEIVMRSLWDCCGIYVGSAPPISTGTTTWGVGNVPLMHAR